MNTAADTSNWRPLQFANSHCYSIQLASMDSRPILPIDPTLSTQRGPETETFSTCGLLRVKMLICKFANEGKKPLEGLVRALKPSTPVPDTVTP